MRVGILLPTKVLQKLVVAAVLSLLRSSTAGRVTVPVKVGLLIGAGSMLLTCNAVVANAFDDTVVFSTVTGVFGSGGTYTSGM